MSKHKNLVLNLVGCIYYLGLLVMMLVSLYLVWGWLGLLAQFLLIIVAGLVSSERDRLERKLCTSRLRITITPGSVTTEFVDDENELAKKRSITRKKQVCVIFLELLKIALTGLPIYAMWLSLPKILVGIIAIYEVGGLIVEAFRQITHTFRREPDYF